MTAGPTTTLGFALLGLLARRSLTGYELSQRMKVPIGYFWTASHSQIYPELARLESQGLVDAEVVPGPGPRDNKRYRITSDGRATLADWVVTPRPEPPVRDELLLRVYSMWLADPDRAAAMIEARIAGHIATAAEYRRLESEILAAHDGGPPIDHPDFGSWATLRRGASYERHALAWCRWMLDQLRAQ